MQTLNIAGYKFIALTELASLQEYFLAHCEALAIKGTLLLSQEGININLAGASADIQSFQAILRNDPRFMDMSFHESYSAEQPFQRLKIKLKNEIITLRQPQANPNGNRAPDISPAELKSWLDEKRDFTLLDTRNDYEVRFGTFKGALNLQLCDFGELPASVEQLDRHKPIVMFCTGGIRCEKAALYMLNQGFSSVYQLDGGILGYFKQVGGAHYDGECFVFDERIAVDCDLQHRGTIQCRACRGPVSKAQQALPSYVHDVSCQTCEETSTNL
jgi:UPF0176 protein